MQKLITILVIGFLLIFNCSIFAKDCPKSLSKQEIQKKNLTCLYKRYFGKGDRVMKTGKYKNGKQDKRWETYYHSGQLNSFSNFKNGKKHGDAAFYDKGGLVIINTNFKNGLLEESKERHKYLKGVKSVKKYKNGFLYSKNEEVDCDITPLYCTTKKVIDKWKKNKLFNSFFS